MILYWGTTKGVFVPTNERWFKWDTLINEGNYQQVVDEFDEMVKKRENVVLGDLIRRDDALELMGIVSLSPWAVYQRRHKK